MKRILPITFILYVLINSLVFAETPGTKKWEFLTDGYVSSSPAIGADGTIYFGSGDQKLYAG